MCYIRARKRGRDTKSRPRVSFICGHPHTRTQSWAAFSFARKTTRVRSCIYGDTYKAAQAGTYQIKQAPAFGFGTIIAVLESGAALVLLFAHRNATFCTGTQSERQGRPACYF